MIGKRKGNLSIELITAVIIFSLISITFLSYSQNMVFYSNQLEKKFVKNITLLSELNKSKIYNNWQSNTVLSSVYIDTFYVQNYFDSYQKSFFINITDTITNQTFSCKIFPYWEGDVP